MPKSTLRTPSPTSLTHLLHEGVLVPVSAAAKATLGDEFSSKTVLRWSVVGRNGVLLPTMRGRLRSRVTTVAAFRAWLALSSGAPIAAAASTAVAQRQAAVDDAVLASHGLGRQQRGGTVGVVGTIAEGAPR